MRKLLALVGMTVVLLVAPGAAAAATGSLTLQRPGAGRVNPVFSASVTLARADCDASGGCEWDAYVIDQPASRGACAATAVTDRGPVAPDHLVDLAPDGVGTVGASGAYTGPGTESWAFTVNQVDIPGAYRLCMYVALPDDSTTNALVAQARFNPPANHGTLRVVRHRARITAKLTVAMNHCIDCHWYPSATEVPVELACPATEGTPVWTRRRSPLALAGPAQFSFTVRAPAPGQPLRLCVYLTSTAPRGTRLLTNLSLAPLTAG